MFERIGRGWRMAGASWSVLKAHPKLVLFPIFSGLAFIALVAAICVPIFAGVTAAELQQMADGVKPNDPLLYVAAFAFYFVCYFIGIFFNSALVFCALEAFAGRTPSLAGGFSAALGRLPQILAWTVVATTVGMLLSALQSFLRDKLGLLGSILGGIGEVAWTVMTYFVTPVLVVEGVGPVTAVKRSASILRQTWGETAGGSGGLGLISFLLTLPVVGVIAAAVMINRNAGLSDTVVAVLFGVVVLYLLALTVVFGALGTIFRTGAFIYATTGNAPAAIDANLLQGAFRKK